MFIVYVVCCRLFDVSVVAIAIEYTISMEKTSLRTGNYLISEH